MTSVTNPLQRSNELHTLNKGTSTRRALQKSLEHCHLMSSIQIYGWANIKKKENDGSSKNSPVKPNDTLLGLTNHDTDASPVKNYGTDAGMETKFISESENCKSTSLLNVAEPFHEWTMAEIIESRDKNVISDFKRNKLESEAQKNWDKFYKRNATKFFKDRHWTKREFQELCNEQVEETSIILEVGCGVGNFIYPLIEDGCASKFYACDFSPRAVQFVKEHPYYSTNQIEAFQCDITKDPLSAHINPDSVHLATMIFVLSAICPDKMVNALQNIYEVLAPGGMLLFRDYGLHDYAMLRFSAGHKISENFYFRQDGTRAYYFTTEYLADLASQSGFTIVENEYVHRETVNKKEALTVPRKFVQAKLYKPDKSNLGEILLNRDVISQSDSNVTDTTQETVSKSRDDSNMSDTTQETVSKSHDDAIQHIGSSQETGQCQQVELTSNHESISKSHEDDKSHDTSCESEHLDQVDLVPNRESISKSHDDDKSRESS